MGDHNPPDKPPHPPSADAFIKRQLEAANNDKSHLQERLRHLETQNKALLKSLFEVSCTPPGAPSPKPLSLDIVAALRRLKLDSLPTAGPTPPPGKGSAYRRSAPDQRLSLSTPNPHSPPPVGLRPYISRQYSPFRARADLIGHASAVYAVQFSPDGQLLASVSFDKSVRFWPITRFLDKSSHDARNVIADAHRAPVVAVEWTFDSARVLTGSLDQTAAEWDVETQGNEAVTRFPCDGLVNAVSVSPANDNVFFACTSRRTLHMFDRRLPKPANTPGMDHGRTTVLSNDAVINTVHITLDGSRFITGDHAGAIKTWDLRMAASSSLGTPLGSAMMVDSTWNDDAHRPITHIHTSPPLVGEEHGRFLAVNSYDAFLRVYDRGSAFFRAARPELKPVQALRGVVGMHWPIKSSFFMGADYRPRQRDARRRRRRLRGRDRLSEGRSTKSEQTADARDDEAEEYGHGSDDGDEESSLSEPSDGMEEETDGWTGEMDDEDAVVGGPIQDMLMLASGSADGMVYMFDVASRCGGGGLLQVLEGHKDRVYTVDFHPSEPIVASCSADSDIKIWHSRSQAFPN